MSSEFIYGKQFIKAKDQFIPMIYAGSSNCYQYDRSNRGRRERSWFNDNNITGGRRIATREQILEEVERIRDEYKARYTGEKDETGYQTDLYKDENFGYFTSMAIGGSTHRTTFGMFKGLYVTGMEKALTIEQLKEEHIQVSISMYDYNGEYQKKAEAMGIKWLKPVFVTDTENLLETINLFTETYKESQFSWSIHFDGWCDEKDMTRLRKKYFPKGGKKEREWATVDHYFTLVVEGAGTYFVKRTRYGYKYTHYPYKNFATEAEANVIKHRLKNRIALKVERVNETTRVKVLKQS